MKKNIVLTVLFLAFSSSFAQLDWEKALNNVISTGFDPAQTINNPKVIFTGTDYKMWYARRKADNTSTVGYATSPNGLDWTLIDTVALKPATDGVRFDYKQAAPEKGHKPGSRSGKGRENGPPRRRQGGQGGDNPTQSHRRRRG